MQSTFQTIGQICQHIENLIINGQIKKLTKFLNDSIGCNDERILISINKVLAKPANLKFTINQILQDSESFDVVKSGSYLHKNGFHKLVLLEGTNFKLRLHHFGAKGLTPMENIHDHRWPFVSSILLGTLRMEMFEINNKSNVGERLEHHQYYSEKSTGRYSTRLLGSKVLKRIKQIELEQGYTYMMMPEELHRIINKPGKESVTLILTGKPIGNTCNLFAKRSFSDEEKQTPSYCPNELRTQLEKLGDMIYPQNN